MMINTLTQALSQALTDFGVTDPVIELDHPAEETFGDWSSNAALQYIQQVEKLANPREFAEALKEKLETLLKTEAGVARITVAGPGFINFTLSEQYWIGRLAVALNQGIAELLPQTGQGKTIVVEYSSPNIAKPFTVGHLRSTIIGDALANLYETLGWEVRRDNHLGDWGTQFGKLIYAIKNWGDQQQIATADRPIKALVDLYVKFHDEVEKDPTIEKHGREWFKKLEDGDAEARRLWQWCVDLSWQEFDLIYDELDIRFTENDGRGYGESFFEDKMNEVLKVLEKKLPKEKLEENGGYYGEGESGAKLVFFKNEALPSLMIVKKDGATLYSTRDLATDYFRLKKIQPDRVVNEVGAEQSLYFRQIFAIEEMLGWYKPGQRVHLAHGLYRFKDKKMSTRKGNVVWLEDIIKEAKQRAQKLSKSNQASANAVAIGALKWNDLKSEAKRNIVFDWDEVLSMKGNSGPYVQYAAVRAQSVLDKAKGESAVAERYSFNSEELSLVRWLDRLEETVQKSAEEYAPHHLATYLFELAQRFNVFYNKHSIITAETADSQRTRLALTAVVRKTLSAGLAILGIETPEEM